MDAAAVTHDVNQGGNCSHANDETKTEHNNCYGDSVIKNEMRSPSPSMAITGHHTSPHSPLHRTGMLPTYKLILAGDVSVGKTSLLSRYCQNEMDQSASSPTVGVEFQTRQVVIPSGVLAVDGRPCDTPAVLQLWDTAGKARSDVTHMSRAYFRGAVGAMMVYDVSRRDSLLSIPGWAAQVRALCGEDCVCIVVGNKIDVFNNSSSNDNKASSEHVKRNKERLQLVQEEAEHIAHSLGMRHMFASAADGDGVLHAFTQLILSVNAMQGLRTAVVAEQRKNTSSHLYGGNNSNDNSSHPSSSSDPHGGWAARGDPLIIHSLRDTYYSMDDCTMWTVPSPDIPMATLSVHESSCYSPPVERTEEKNDTERPSLSPPAPSSPNHNRNGEGDADGSVPNDDTSALSRWRQRAANAARRKHPDLRGFGSAQPGQTEDDVGCWY